jgi:hypothetical protein
MWRRKSGLDLAVQLTGALWLFITITLFLTGCERRNYQHDSQHAGKDSVGTVLGPFVDELKGTTFHNQLVFLNNVKLEAGPKEGVMYAVGQQGIKVLLITNLRKQARPLDGETADVTGLLQRPPSRTAMRANWHLSKVSASEVAAQDVVIVAREIHVED